MLESMKAAYRQVLRAGVPDSLKKREAMSEQTAAQVEGAVHVQQVQFLATYSLKQRGGVMLHQISPH